ncbi:hypothetical protein BDV97DRAFT_293210 [Delphinella strobiligena]|nr:hypothetical protein BDV97DRAFT_293210 [Delphinella strobiligena]
MAARTLLRSPATAMLRNTINTQTRSFQTSRRLLETPTGALPVRKPVGAFRGGLLGFLFGATAAGSGLYYYVIDEYKVSNELLTEDIYALQSAVQRIEGYVKTLEEKTK